ncbi:17255_t:CDS:1, partial [Dentiscutata erythropus]
QVGYWRFGDYRYLDPAGEFLGTDKINKCRIEDMDYINQIIEENISSKQILENPKELLPRSWLRSLQDLTYIEQRREKLVNEELKKFWHPVTFYFYGEGGAGKSNL